MEEAAPQPHRGKLAGAALAFALLAALGSWNPVAAPLGLVVAVAAGLIAWRALRTGRGRPRTAHAAIVVAGASAAVAVTVLVLAATAVGTRLEESGPAAMRSPAEAKAALDEAAARTRSQRDDAARELARVPVSRAPAARLDAGARRAR